MGLENISLTDVDWPSGSENIGSLSTQIWFAPKSDFQKNGIPSVPTNPTTLEAAGKVSGSYTFKTGKGWNKIDIIRETGSIIAESQGEYDGKSFLNKLAFIIAGNTAQGIGFARFCNNTDLIVIVRESQGQYRQMGDELFGAKASAINPSTGATTAERKQIAFELTYPSVSPAPIVEDYDPDGDWLSSSVSLSV